MTQAFLILFGVINLLLALYSIPKIKQDKKSVSFIWWWAFINGSFVWEDMLVFGLLHFGFAIVGILTQNITIWVICFLVFWMVRSAGETLYFFLEQFIVPKHHPHYIEDQLKPLRKIFGDIDEQKCFIIMQVIHQSVLISSIIALIFILRL